MDSIKLRTTAPIHCSNILLADDQQIILDGFASLLEHSHNYYLAGTALNGQLAMEKIMMKPYQYDVLITDISMPLLSGIDLCRMVKVSYPHILVVMLSMYTSCAMIEDAVKAGADGYLVKTMSSTEMLGILACICSGIKCFGTAPAAGGICPDLKKPS